MKRRIMYIESKSGENTLVGNARIGQVQFSKTGKSVHYNGKTFQTLSGQGFKANYFDTETEEYYWISGCKKTALTDYMEKDFQSTLTKTLEKNIGLKLETYQTVKT